MKLPDTLNAVATAVLSGIALAGAIGIFTLRDTVISQGHQLAAIQREQDARAGIMGSIAGAQPGIKRDLADVRERVNWLQDAVVEIGRAIDPALRLPPPPPLRNTGDER